MSNILYLNTHTQLGDHIICYGLVKEISKKYDKIFISTKPHNFNNVIRLYESISNVEIITGNEYKIANKTIIIGHKQLFDDMKKDKTIVFDKYWYDSVNIPFNLKWDNFYFKRDLEKEKNIFYNILKLTDDDKFALMQEDSTRNYIITRDYINPNLKLIETSKILNISIFDLFYTIEKASEVHVINSSFLNLIDLMNLKHNNLNYHKYTRPNPQAQPTLRLDWNIITDKIKNK